MQKILDIIPPYFQQLIGDFISRMQQEKVHITAGYLAYVSLMSLVPLLVVMFSVMTAFPLFSDVREAIEGFVFSNFLPTSGELIRGHLTGFVNNASKMSVVALSFLFLFALLLMSAIDKSLNRIWRVKEKRRMMTSFSLYWLVLTLGPIIVSLSISLSSYILALVAVESVEEVQAGKTFLFLLPFLVSTIGFYFLYLAVPNKRVPIKFALIGACTAAILFEIAKKAFAFYLLQLPSYQAIYGTLAIIPILFLWVYLSWVIVLSGAVLAVSLENQAAKNLEQD
ncbi:MAG: virulence factor BrkB family protein [Thalassotalea sp.]